MTLDQLKMLKAVMQEGSLQGASNILHKTQPAISKGLQQLEATLGVTVLDRSGYNTMRLFSFLMSPTAYSVSAFYYSWMSDAGYWHHAIAAEYG